MPLQLTVDEEVEEYRWTCRLAPPAQSAYHGGKFKIQFAIPKDYPFQGPKITFLTPIHHFAVGPHGEVCGCNVTKQNWTPARTIQQLLQMVVDMFVDMESQLCCTMRGELFESWKHQLDVYTRDAAEHAAKFASHTDSEDDVEELLLPEATGTPEAPEPAESSEAPENTMSKD